MIDSAVIVGCRRAPIVAFTGHRPDKLGGWDPLHPIVGQVRRAIRSALIETWPREVISGMALGVDQWAVQEALDLGIPFVAAIPCDHPEARWPLPSKERYLTLLAQAVRVVNVRPGPYYDWKMDRRNEWMVDHCDFLFAVWDRSRGGTANCIAYARTVGREVRELDFST